MKYEVVNNDNGKAFFMAHPTDAELLEHAALLDEHTSKLKTILANTKDKGKRKALNYAIKMLKEQAKVNRLYVKSVPLSAYVKARFPN